MKDYKINWRRAVDLSDIDLAECAALFSEHYGRWGSAANQRLIGKPIILSADKLCSYLKAPESWAALAHSGENLIGYAFLQRLHIHGKGYVTWVTQFVVHREHRNQGLGTRILRATWSQSNQYAWGLVTANPFAIRALEKATLRHCDPVRIRMDWPQLHEAAKPNLDYVSNAHNALGFMSTALDTDFPLDHTDSKKSLEILERRGHEWRLGDLGESEEWVAFTFSDQKFFNGANRLLDEWIADCDRTVRDAYDSMSLDTAHKWARHTSHEIDVFLMESRSKLTDVILDVGCGPGRHSIELAKRGYSICGIDFVPRHIEAAKGMSNKNNLMGYTQFTCGDIRDHIFENEFDHAICFYDVIGSFASDIENRRIVENIFRHLKPGGTFIASIMNGELTAEKALHSACSDNLFEKLLALEPSNIMQQTGNIFDPHFYLWHEDAGVAYRKEQFEGDSMAPCELIVRDRRYSSRGISDICSAVGFEILNIRFVQLGNWVCSLDPLSEKAKEMLLVCKKPPAAMGHK